jgi:surface polysaccharide O-acyltransferase-like enzyme
MAIKLMIELYKKKINLGIEILRTCMCFFIVILHIFDLSNINNNSFTSFIFRTHQYYVPTFVFISFYFSFITLNSKNISKIKDRFLRIILPLLYGLYSFG